MIGQGTLPWQPILGAKSAEIYDTPSFLGLAFHNGRQDRKADGALTAQNSFLHKNLVNFGPLTPEFTVTVWRPFMRQRLEIVEMRSIFGTRIRFDNG